MRSELLQFIPKDARILGMLHDPGFRPDQAPNAHPVENGRVIFEQDIVGLANAQLVRAPVCLLTEGDTALIKTLGPEEGLFTVQKLTQTIPTAAMIFDAFHALGQASSIAWFCEDELYAKTVSHNTGIEQERLLPLFQDQSDQIVELLRGLSSFVSKNRVEIHKLPFSDPRVKEAIEQAIVQAATSPDFNSQDRRKLKDTSAAIIASTHALFTPIAQSLIGEDKLCAVQGPVHLETNPPHWKNNQALSTVVRLVKHSTTQQPNPHRSLLPCLFRGEPIDEFSAFDDNSPQLRRDQRWKLEQWTKWDPFSLVQNPIFGHSIGLLEDPQVEKHVKDLLSTQACLDREAAAKIQIALAHKIDQVLTAIDFWR